MEDNPHYIYLNTAACGLVSEKIALAGIEFYKTLSKNGSKRAESWRESEATRIRKNIADFLDAPEQNLAMIPGFSHGMNAVVQSLNGSEKILLYEKDYPSLINPFQVNNFDISWLPATGDGFQIDPNFIEQKVITEKIDLVALSHVQWLSGAKTDLKRIIDICHKHQIPIIVDATQSLGAMPVSLKDLPADVLIASNYKWMNAGFGTGIIYLSDAFLQTYPPVFGGVNSYELKDGRMIRQPSVLDMEPGHLNMAGFSILEAAIQDKKQRGLKAIEEHNQQLTRLFLAACANLPIKIVGPLSMENRCSIIVLKDEDGLGKWLQENNFVVTLRNETIRLGFHYYNTLEEVEQLINCLQAFSPDKN